MFRGIAARGLPDFLEIFSLSHSAPSSPWKPIFIDNHEENLRNLKNQMRYDDGEEQGKEIRWKTKGKR